MAKEGCGRLKACPKKARGRQGGANEAAKGITGSRCVPSAVQFFREKESIEGSLDEVPNG